ncbi:MAG TPA: spermidine/putrescine ABC transporter substrate-binding protein [Actinomycetota bacterium]|nr:spermidine/putrescine ABC transporter substrate-binding protein [Actinomycetota bacterium]
MTERDPRRIDPAWMRGMTRKRMSRRQLFRYTGAGVGAYGLASLLAACGTDPETAPSVEPGGVGSPEWWADQEAGDLVRFTNWPAYIDIGKDAEGNRTRPSLDLFIQETGIDVEYRANINDNADFYASILPALEAGQDPGHDIIVITNGQELAEMQARGFLIELDHSLTPNFNENVGAAFKDPAFDPGNRYTMAWQSGMTGYAWNKEFVEGPITGMRDLMRDEWRGKVALMGNDDAPTLAMIELGINPETSTPDDWQAAADLLNEFNEWGGLRKWEDQGYLTGIENGDLWATMAWSGDIINDLLYYPEYASFEFATAEAGGLVWVDNMMIPANAANPKGAIMVMDHYYKPEIAAMLTEWNAYVSPVPAGGELVQQHADEAKGGTKEVLNTIANSPYVFPTPELEDKLYNYRVLEGDEVEQWNDLFQPIFET